MSGAEVLFRVRDTGPVVSAVTEVLGQSEFGVLSLAAPLVNFHGVTFTQPSVEPASPTAPGIEEDSVCLRAGVHHLGPGSF